MQSIPKNPILKTKDISNHLKCCPRTSYKILKDIKQQYKIQYVTFNHLLKYLKL